MHLAEAFRGGPPLRDRRQAVGGETRERLEPLLLDRPCTGPRVTGQPVVVAPAAGCRDALDEPCLRQQGVSPLKAMRAFRSTIAPMMAGILRSAAEAAVAFRPDVIVHHPKILSADLAGAQLGVPTVLVEMVPVSTPTATFPAPGVVSANLGPLNRTTYRAADAAAGMFRGVLRDLRAELGLPKKGALPTRARSLVTASPALLPRPADWPETTILTGQLHEPDATPAALDPELESFLAADGDVLYAGFGSMAAGDGAARGRAIAEAARAAGLRILVATGWGGLVVPDELRGEDLLVRSAVPHAAVLPRCAVAIHHGGAGTVHAVVRAGLPSIVVPFLADQPFWGRLLARRGLGAPPVSSGKVSRDRMVAALAAVPSRSAVQPVAEQLRSEDGCAVALEALGSVA